MKEQTKAESKVVLHELSEGVDCGIWTATRTIRVYRDYTVVVLPVVSWVGGSGSLGESRRRIGGALHRRILNEFEMDADRDESQLWNMATSTDEITDY